MADEPAENSHVLPNPQLGLLPPHFSKACPLLGLVLQPDYSPEILTINRHLTCTLGIIPPNPLTVAFENVGHQLSIHRPHPQ